MGITVTIADRFGEDVFNDETMRRYLSENDYRDFRQSVEERSSFRFETAKAVAEAMKRWAVERGATHYTHWFQPMTNATAEKHEAFISAPENGKVMLEFSGKELMMSEPDASSFPSGGLRSTFEARGYTAWDRTSPAFIRETGAGRILCIPTAFCSYTGEALDKKTPLLRSMQTIDREAVRLLHAIGCDSVKRVTPMVGAEQEYFLIDREKFLQREDIMMSGRTLFGAAAPKGQELGDHYFGSIRERIGAFMKEVNEELWRMGVPGKTQHNETAPAQHELACIFSEANITTDQNQIVMDCLKRVAYKHGLHCLLHEKPFAGVNGSGKHNNWSLVTDEGVNLLEPGSTPHENSRFLLIFTCVLAAVDRHADLLRAAAVCPGNDLRLGAQEAPPAIISAFVGDQLTNVLQQLIEQGQATSSLRRHHLHTGVTTLPEFMKDATDRNRTSPFAFTGNKFEFRMLGASDSVACVNTILNTIVAEAFSEASDRLEKAEDVAAALQEIIIRNAVEHERILYDGDGYSEEWLKEAERRGLPNLRSSVDAIPALTRPENVELLSRFGVFSASELAARAEVKFDAYVQTMKIETRTMVEMANRQILPAGLRYQREVAESLLSARSTGLTLDLSAQEGLLTELSGLLGELKGAADRLAELLRQADRETDLQQEARFFRDFVVPAKAALRTPADKLETLVRKELWPFPTYTDLMFEV